MMNHPQKLTPHQEEDNQSQFLSLIDNNVMMNHPKKQESNRRTSTGSGGYAVLKKTHCVCVVFLVAACMIANMWFATNQAEWNKEPKHFKLPETTPPSPKNPGIDTANVAELLATCIELAEATGKDLVAAIESSRNDPQDAKKALHALRVDPELWRNSTRASLEEDMSAGLVWKAAWHLSQKRITEGIMEAHPGVQVDSKDIPEYPAAITIDGGSSDEGSPPPPKSKSAVLDLAMAHQGPHNAENASAVSVWVDALDGMKEFAFVLANNSLASLLPAVTVQLCIVVDGRAEAAVIHQPFADRRTDWVWGNQTSIQPHTYKKNRVIVASTGKVKRLQGLAARMKATVAGADGSAHKAMMLVEGQFDWYMQSTFTVLLEVCPAHAFLAGLGRGGGVLDWKGRPLVFRNHESRTEGGFIAARTQKDLEEAVLAINAEEQENEEQEKGN